MVKCSTCYGFGLWGVGNPSPVGAMDASGGVPTKKCPECGAKGVPKNSWRTLKGEYIPIKDLEDDHLVNIIKHIAERNSNLKENKKLLSKMLKEQERRDAEKGIPTPGLITDKLELSGSIGGRTNTRKWGSKKRDIKEDHHKKGKKWYIHNGLKRTKLRWNKKKGVQEKSKKGSRDRIYWAD